MVRKYRELRCDQGVALVKIREITEALNNEAGICNSMMTCISEGGDFCCCLGIGFIRLVGGIVLV